MSVEGKFLSKEISELFWKENLTLATAGAARQEMWQPQLQP